MEANRLQRRIYEAIKYDVTPLALLFPRNMIFLLVPSTSILRSIRRPLSLPLHTPTRPFLVFPILASLK